MAEIERLQNRVDALEKSQRPTERPPERRKERRAESPRRVELESEIAAQETTPADLCWQDYCPCEPPQGGPDQGLCRQLRAGMRVDEELLSAGAMMRDARRQLREYEAEHGSFD